MTIAEFQTRVEWVIGELERMHDRQYPLRSIPMDMVTEAVARECGCRTVSERQSIGARIRLCVERIRAWWRYGVPIMADNLARLHPHQIADALNAILKRNMGTAAHFNVTPDALDAVSPWRASSYLPHEGVDRLSDGSSGIVSD